MIVLFLLFLDSSDFRKRHPITTYEHYRELIGHIAAGEEKVIISEKPLILAMTSGTSGPSAMLLSTRDTNSEFFLQVIAAWIHADLDQQFSLDDLKQSHLNLSLLQGVTVCLDAMRKAFPETDGLQRTTKFFYSPMFRQSEAGIPIGPNSSTPASSRHMLNLYTTPEPAFEVQTFFGVPDGSTWTL